MYLELNSNFGKLYLAYPIYKEQYQVPTYFPSSHSHHSPGPHTDNYPNCS